MQRPVPCRPRQPLPQEGLLETPYSPTEARLIFELGRRGEMDVADLRTTLGLDAGYLSRIRVRLEEAGLVTRARSGGDRRRHVIGLTRSGRAAYEVLNGRSAARAQALVGRLGEHDQRVLVDAMQTTERLLGGHPSSEATLRPPRPGDLGWVVERHGALYAAEYGWDATFEALVARIVADFAAGADPAVEQAWAGSVFCTRRDERSAQLRLLLVEPAFRGQGLGRRLVDECLAFARSAGYTRIVLWTNDVLVDARRIYERAGFVLVAEGRPTSFGSDRVEQTWSRPL